MLMTISVETVIRYAWEGLGALWLGAAAFTRRSVQVQPLGSRLVQLLIALPGFALVIGAWPDGGWMGRPFAPCTPATAIFGLLITLAGCLFAAWARAVLGVNWSGSATVKEGHELVTHGPYALCRHPIYTGLLLTACGTALVVDRWRCVLGIILLVLALVLKMTQEEQLMMQAFPAAYPQYRSRIKALIPGIL